MPLVVIEVVKGSELPSKDPSGKSDPYVVGQLASLNDPGTSRPRHAFTHHPRRSLTKLQTLDPVWRFYVDIDVHDPLDEVQIHFVVAPARSLLTATARRSACCSGVAEAKSVAVSPGLGRLGRRPTDCGRLDVRYINLSSYALLAEIQLHAAAARNEPRGAEVASALSGAGDLAHDDGVKAYEASTKQAKSSERQVTVGTL
jgi:hypothetical protein